MFKNQYQRGSKGVEILSAAGSDPAKHFKMTGSVQKIYDKEAKGFIFSMDRPSKFTSMQCPKVTRSKEAMGIIQPLLILQILHNIEEEMSFSMEVVILDSCMQRRRLFFGTAIKKVECNGLHIQIPWPKYNKNEWVSICIDLDSINTTLFPGSTFRSLEMLSINPVCRIRKIFSLPYFHENPFIIPTEFDFHNRSILGAQSGLNNEDAGNDQKAHLYAGASPVYMINSNYIRMEQDHVSSKSKNASNVDNKSNKNQSLKQNVPKKSVGTAFGSSFTPTKSPSIVSAHRRAGTPTYLRPKSGRISDIGTPNIGSSALDQSDCAGMNRNGMTRVYSNDMIVKKEISKPKTIAFGKSTFNDHTPSNNRVRTPQTTRKDVVTIATSPTNRMDIDSREMAVRVPQCNRAPSPLATADDDDGRLDFNDSEVLDVPASKVHKSHSPLRVSISNSTAVESRKSGNSLSSSNSQISIGASGSTRLRHRTSQNNVAAHVEQPIDLASGSSSPLVGKSPRKLTKQQEAGAFPSPRGSFSPGSASTSHKNGHKQSRQWNSSPRISSIRHGENRNCLQTSWGDGCRSPADNEWNPKVVSGASVQCSTDHPPQPPPLSVLLNLPSSFSNPRPNKHDRYEGQDDDVTSTPFHVPSPRASIGSNSVRGSKDCESGTSSMASFSHSLTRKSSPLRSQHRNSTAEPTMSSPLRSQHRNSTAEPTLGMHTQQLNGEGLSTSTSSLNQALFAMPPPRLSIIESSDELEEGPKISELDDRPRRSTNNRASSGNLLYKSPNKCKSPVKSRPTTALNIEVDGGVTKTKKNQRQSRDGSGNCIGHNCNASCSQESIVSTSGVGCSQVINDVVCDLLHKYVNSGKLQMSINGSLKSSTDVDRVLEVGPETHMSSKTLPTHSRTSLPFMEKPVPDLPAYRNTAQGIIQQASNLSVSVPSHSFEPETESESAVDAVSGAAMSVSPTPRSPITHSPSRSPLTLSHSKAHSKLHSSSDSKIPIPTARWNSSVSPKKSSVLTASSIDEEIRQDHKLQEKLKSHKDPRQEQMTGNPETTSATKTLKPSDSVLHAMLSSCKNRLLAAESELSDDEY